MCSVPWISKKDDHGTPASQQGHITHAQYVSAQENLLNKLTYPVGICKWAVSIHLLVPIMS